MNARAFPFIACVLLLSACGSSPTAPTRMIAQQRETAPAFDVYGFVFDGESPSHCVVKNVSDHPMIKGCIVQDMRDPSNPTDAGHGFSGLLQPGDVATLTYFVTMNACDPYQMDGLDNVAASTTGIVHLTESDIHNNHVDALGRVLQASNCRNPPSTTTTTIPAGPTCSPDAFSSHEGHVDGTAPATIIEHMTVKPGYDGIVAYLVSWGVPALRLLPGDVPLPQARVYLTTQTLHVGANVMTAPVASPSVYPGWQWEWGCEAGPPILTDENLYDFAFIEGGWGNFTEAGGIQ